MKIVYPVRFTFLKDEKDTVLIEVPDLDILSEGYGLSNAIDMARDAIEFTMVTLEDNNMPVPVASDEKELCKMDGMFSSEGYTMLSLVDADSTNYRRKEYNDDIDCYVKLPKWLDFEARSAGINISSVLQDALISKLGIAQ